jgi:signal transduction histidine kinase
MPTAKDGARTRDALGRAGLACAVCKDLAELCREVAAGAGVVLLTEEAVVADQAGRLAETLRDQPAWSDLPLVVLAREGGEGRQESFREAGNVTLVERPVRLRSLLSVVRTALRSRRHQYAIRDHLAERERQAEALREQDRRKDEFLALLAHELRNPLAPLRNGLQVMRLAVGDANAVAEARSMMDRQLGHMVRLIDDLLDVSRINRNKMELRRARILLGDVINSAVETARPGIEAEGHELSVALPPEPVYLDADLTRLAQVLGNLLSNSAKYTPPGGHIGLTAALRGEEVVVSVRDDGIGIPAEALPNIFDMFSQVDRSIERATGGLGIGLALVKGLVEMHGGAVTAESPGPGKGSTFTVRLRALPAHPEGADEDAPQGGVDANGGGRRILVVDDNQDSALSMAMMLRLTGNQVRTAHDGVEAVEAAEAFRPQVILMDVGMPRLNGYEATRRIREQPWGRSATIIAHRLGAGGRQGALARGRLRRPPGQAGEPAGPGTAARRIEQWRERACAHLLMRGPVEGPIFNGLAASLGRALAALAPGSRLNQPDTLRPSMSEPITPPPSPTGKTPSRLAKS